MIKQPESNYEIEQFNLEKENFSFLSKLITGAFLNDSTAQVEGASIAFTEETFNTIFGAPSVDRKLFIRAIFKPTNQIVGFLGSIPRDLKIEGKVYKFAIPAWLSVHSKHQRKGIAKSMGKKLFEIGKTAGYDGGFSLHEPEQHGIDISKIVASEEDMPLERLVTLDKFIIRVFDAEKVASVVNIKWYEKLVFKLLQSVKRVNNPRVRNYNPGDIDKMLDVVKEQVDRNQIAIVPNVEDLKWILGNPNVNCVVHENEEGNVDGFILAWEFNLAGFGNKIPFGWLDMVHIHRLSLKEARDLCKLICITSKQRGWIGLQTPYIPYFDSKPFKKAKFIFFTKKITIDIFNLKNIPLPKNVQGFYFDWR